MGMSIITTESSVLRYEFLLRRHPARCWFKQAPTHEDGSEVNKGAAPKGRIHCRTED